MINKEFDCVECAATFSLIYAPNDDKQKPLYCPFCSEELTVDAEDEELNFN